MIFYFPVLSLSGISVKKSTYSWKGVATLALRDAPVYFL